MERALQDCCQEQPGSVCIPGSGEFPNSRAGFTEEMWDTPGSRKLQTFQELMEPLEILGRDQPKSMDTPLGHQGSLKFRKW